MSGGPRIDPGRGEATWRDGAAPPVYRPQGVRDWLRVIRRGLPAVLVLLIGVILILPLRGIERLFRRPPTLERAACADHLSADAALHGYRLAA